MSINNLNAGTIATSDQIPFFSTSNGQDRKASVSELLALASASASGDFIEQYSAPNATGFSVTITPPTTGDKVWLILTPAAGYAAGTIVYPPVAQCVNGQEILVNCTQSVTTLTTTGNGSTVYGAPTTLAANAFFRMRFNGVNQSWYRVG